MKYLILILTVVSCKNYCPLPASKIVSVGGCDRHGKCGIMLENGHTDTAYFPVVGAYRVKRIKCEEKK